MLILFAPRNVTSVLGASNGPEKKFSRLVIARHILRPPRNALIRPLLQSAHVAALCFVDCVQLYFIIRHCIFVLTVCMVFTMSCLELRSVNFYYTNIISYCIVVVRPLSADCTHYNDRTGVCFTPPELLQLTAAWHQRWTACSSTVSTEHCRTSGHGRSNGGPCDAHTAPCSYTCCRCDSTGSKCNCMALSCRSSALSTISL